jgi:CDP-diacylglycerol--glycerol-3-phosphate 3-phosphatidyltransferase
MAIGRRPAAERWLRLGYLLATVCARLRVAPGGVTAAGLIACLFVPLVARHGGAGALLGALLVVVAGVADTVDGALAVLIDRTTRLGYVYDSLADRLAEVCWLVAFALIGVPAVVCVAVGGMSWLHEYARARANAAGMTEIAAVTVGEHPTRVVLTVIGLALSGMTGTMSREAPAGVATVCVAVWLVLSLIGFAQLFAAVHRALAGRTWPSWRTPGTTLADAMTLTGRRPHPPAVPDRADTDTDTDDADFDAELRAELDQLDALPSGTAVYKSSAAPTDGRHHRADDAGD